MKQYAESTIVDRLFDLYIIQHYHYLIQLAGGHYITVNNRDKPLRKYMFSNHLAGKSTIGTFAANYLTKFITFDIDYIDPDMARWATYKLAATLDIYGIDYVISYSGGKGYHVDVFLDKAISNETAGRFFNFIINAADMDDVPNGKVEFRPAAAQGVKLPLGIHQKTGQYCGFCTVENGLAVMGPVESQAHLMNAQKTSHELVLEVIAEFEGAAYDVKDAQQMEDAIARHRPLLTYDQSESFTLTRAAERYEKGITGPGQRHNSFLLLARFFNHHGIEQDETIALITEWFARQDKSFYTTDTAACAKDLRECVAYVYDKGLTLTVEPRDLTVSFAEIDAIIRNCPQKNQKALAYAMLVHSKRWASDTGAFFMTYQQMADAAGFDWRTSIRQIEALERLGVVQVAARNRKQAGTYKKLPNVYKMTLPVMGVEGPVIAIENGGDFSTVAKQLYADHELKALLPRRQYEALIVS